MFHPINSSNSSTIMTRIDPENCTIIKNAISKSAELHLIEQIRQESKWTTNFITGLRRSELSISHNHFKQKIPNLEERLQHVNIVEYRPMAGDCCTWDKDTFLSIGSATDIIIGKETIRLKRRSLVIFKNNMRTTNVIARAHDIINGSNRLRGVRYELHF